MSRGLWCQDLGAVVGDMAGTHRANVAGEVVTENYDELLVRSD